MPASLFVVATPIGNLEDITLRAVRTLKEVALIAAEDTRRTGTLLRHFGITTPATSFHAHNEQQKLPQLLHKLAEGHNLALVSDAGTPVVADPGQRLIAAAIQHGIKVVPIPGPSAVMAALVVSGLPADDFVFSGFAPSKSNDLKKWLEKLADEPRTVVFFEAPHRIRKTLAAISLIFGERPITVCRELTKIHEEVVRLPATEAATLQIAEKGEFSLVIGPKPAVEPRHEPIEDKDVYAVFCHLTETTGLERRDALGEAAQRFGLSTNEAYAAVERFKKSGSS